jgi:Putative inner membrane protein (DUF1819)
MIVPPANKGVTYTQALSRGGALLDETRLLLRAWQPGESFAALTERVRREDTLGRATARRVSDIVRVFTTRFLTPSDAPARHLRDLVVKNAPRQIFGDLVFYYTALQDDLLRDFTVLHYWPAVREGRITFTPQDVRHLILEAEQDGRIRSPWPSAIKRDMAARVLNTLTDFGLFHLIKISVCEVAPYRPADGTIVYMSYLLHTNGITDSSLAEHSAWALFGLQAEDVWNRLEVLAGDGWFIIQRAGQVVRITWKYQSMEDAVHAIAR